MVRIINGSRADVPKMVEDFDQKFPLLEDQYLKRLRLCVMLNFTDKGYEKTGVNIHSRAIYSQMLGRYPLNVHQLQISLEGSNSESVEEMGAGRMHYHNISQKPGVRGYFSPSTLLSVRRRAKEVFRENDINCVHVRTPNTPAGIACCMAAKEMGIPLVVTYHGGVRASLGKSVVEAVTMPLAKRLSGHRLGVSMGALEHLGDATYIGNGVDVEFYDPDRKPDSDFFKNHPEMDGKHVIFVPGRIMKLKGQLDLVKSLPDLPKDKLDGAHVALAGIIAEADYMRQIRDFAAKHGLSDKITYLGALDNDGMYDALNSCFMLGGPSYEEGCPRIVLEAGAMKKPVIASDVGGVPEAMVDKETGLLFPAGDTKAIASAMDRLLSNPGLAHRMGVMGRDYVCTNFDRRSLADRHLRLYSRIMRDLYAPTD